MAEEIVEVNVDEKEVIGSPKTPNKDANTGALAHRLQRRTACNTPPPTLSKMADGVRKYVKPYVIGHSDQFLLNKFLIQSFLL